MPDNITIFHEAKITPKDAQNLTGREWDVTIIGAQSPDDLATIEGRQFIRSKNGRLYSVDAIKESTELWNGVKVYDNHLTTAEFEAKQGMRSPAKEWLGTIVKPYWDAAQKQLRGTFKVVESAVAEKLKNAWESDVLGSIGLSIDTFPIIGKETMLEGQRIPIIEGFKKILSVDLVGDPAAGGGFNRLIASQQIIKEQVTTMDENQVLELVQAELAKLDIKGSVSSALAEALAVEAEEVEAEEEAQEGKGKKKGKKMPMDDEEEDEYMENEEPNAVQEALARIALAKSEIVLEGRLLAAKLDDIHEKMVRHAFEGRVFDESDLAEMIKTAKEAQAAADPSGRVTESGNGRQQISVGIDPSDKLAVEFMRLMMGNRQFSDFRQSLKAGEKQHEYVQERLTEYRNEARFIEAWGRDGYSDYYSFNRMSTLLEAWLGGNPLLDGRALEAVTSTTLATVVKNTVNLMVASDYSKRHLWYEPLVTVEEVDTIDQSTLARLYGISTLPIVNEGATYTELTQSDEEETASFVKKGGYIGITLETMMLDKLNYIRSIPMRMTNAWYNTLSAATAAVFTTNTAAGPVLSDSGALFNATAVTSAGGHANLLTTALSHAAYSAARTAMRKQTDQPLGIGEKLQLTPKYLLVPEDLEITALDIRNSLLVPEANGAGTTGNQTANAFYQKFEVIVVPTWTDTNNWALAADPALNPAIYHIFPRGARTPSLFTADSEVTGAMFTNDEMRFKIRQMTYQFSSTYQCSPVADFRPLHKSNV